MGDLAVQLLPSDPSIRDGQREVDLTIDIKNNSDIIDQYPIDIRGLDSGWFTPPSDQNLFPGTREQVTVTIRPTGTGLNNATYPFTVRVRARGGGAEETVSGVLSVFGEPKPQLSFERGKLSGRRKGDFSLAIANKGGGDADLSLEGTDAEAACKFRFGGGDRVVVPPGGVAKKRVRVQPRKRPWVGLDKTYNFSVTSRLATGATQTVPGQYTHRPFLRTWGPVKAIGLGLIAICGLAIVAGLLASAGLVREFPNRFAIGSHVAFGAVCRVPALAARCPLDAFAAIPEPARGCVYASPFEEYAEASKELIGPCISRVAYDEFGNGMQYSTRGVLFWQKDSSTVYFIVDHDVYAQLQGRSELLHHTP